SLSIMEPIR
nr:RecName: Full=Putative acid phosphatase PS18 [Pinus strobus]